MKKRYFLRYSVLFSLLFLQFPVLSDELCRATLDCPPDYDGDTVTVNYNVVMLSEIFEHCAPDSVKEGNIDTTKDTISLFIIIDHSSSMQFLDPNSTRYTVVEDLIDSVYANSPASEIGIAVFSNKLLHNYQTDSFFDVLDNSQAQGWSDSYVPFTRLDSQVGAVSAVDKLKWAIELSDTELDPGGNKKLVNADYGSSGRRAYTGGTDISLGFEAAKEAFQSASYIEERQFIVLLSDGVHQLIDPERQASAIDYVSGENVPTTFTAFFINQTQPIPDTIRIMTENIKNNGYSENNIFSEVWGTQASLDEFFDKLLFDIIGQGLYHYTSNPISMTVNGITTTTFDDTFAFFDPPFAPLSKNGDLTLDISYTWHWNDPIDQDETKNYSIYVVQGNNPDLESVDCWNQGSIGIYYQSNQIAVAGPTQLQLEVRFFPPDSGDYPPIGNAVDLELTNADRSDVLNVTANVNATRTYYTANFSRDYAAPVVDAILQNSNTDSIIVIYRNPDIPLDTIRYAIRVLPLLDMTLAGAYYLDQDADGHPDVVRMKLGGGQVLTREDCAVMKPYTSIIGPRNVGAPDSLVPNVLGFDIYIPEPAAGTPGYTDLYYDSYGNKVERVTITCSNVTLPSGATFPFTDTIIVDSMAPVINSATYYNFSGATAYDSLVVVFSEDILKPTHTQPFKFYRAALDSVYMLNLTWVRGDSNMAVFSTVPVAGQLTPQAGDSININTAAMVSDVKNNAQTNPDNIRRLLNYYLAYRLQSVIYLDTSSCPDGLIDIIQVTTDVVPDPAILQQLLVSGNMTIPGYQDFIITDVVATDSGFAIVVSQSAVVVPDPALDSLWINTTITSSNSVIFPIQLPISDGVPPVIMKAEFYPKFVQQAGMTVYDTLVITFSEPVSSPPYNTDTPFIFKYVSGGQTYTMILQPLSSDDNGQIQTFLVLSSQKEFPENGDPVSIDPVAGIADLLGNIQSNANNRPVPLQVKQYRFVINVSISTNPVITFDQTITIKGISGRGIGIIVDIPGGWPSWVTLTGTCNIYDAVGNLLAELSGTPTSDNKNVVYFWDGRNQNDRRVYGGTYLGLVIINSSQGLNQRQKVFIGVKQEVADPFWRGQ